MTTKRAEVLLGSGNYFHWEYNMRMTLARKGLLAHVQAVKVESEITEAWLVNDAKALGIIAQGVELQHQTKIRSATRAIEAWGTLREFYNRTTLHNRVTMTRRLHEFKMDDGASMSKHLDAFDELVVGLQTLGEPVDEARQLVVLLSSLPVEFELISSIIENAKDFTLIEVKEKLLRTVALSSAEAEYMALSLCVQEVLWTRAMLTDMGTLQRNATTIWEDNQGAIALAQNAGYHARTKHVDIRHHFIRENVERGTVKVEYIDTKNQLADILTKALGTKTLKFLRDGNGIKEKVTVP